MTEHVQDQDAVVSGGAGPGSSPSRMRIMVGLDGADSPASVRDLVESGADEFFAGYVPAPWSDRFGWEVSLNRRHYGQQCQFTRLQDLQAVLDAIHGCGKRLSIALNAHQYAVPQMALVVEAVRELDGLGVDAYVVADPALMLLLRAIGVTTPLHLSTGVGAFNPETIRFFCSLGRVEQVVLPRKLSLTEMAALIRELPDLHLDFEVMVLGYRCHFNDEFCFSWHSGLTNNLCGRFLHAQRDLRRRFPENWKEMLEDMIAAPDAQFEAGSPLDRLLKHTGTRLPAVAPEQPPEAAPGSEAESLSPRICERTLINCGFCAVPQLRAMGVRVLKLALRGDTGIKQRLVRLARTVLDQPNPTPEFCRGLVNSPSFCATPGACYYHMGGEERA